MATLKKHAVVLFDLHGETSVVSTDKLLPPTLVKLAGRPTLYTSRKQYLVEVLELSDDTSSLKSFQTKWLTTHRALAIEDEVERRQTENDHNDGGFLNIWPEEERPSKQQRKTPTLKVPAIKRRATKTVTKVPAKKPRQALAEKNTNSRFPNNLEGSNGRKLSVLYEGSGDYESKQQKPNRQPVHLSQITEDQADLVKMKIDSFSKQQSCKGTQTDTVIIISSDQEALEWFQTFQGAGTSATKDHQTITHQVEVHPLPTKLPTIAPEPTQHTDDILQAPLPDKVPEPTQLTDVIVPAPLPDKVPEPTQLTDVIVPAPLPDKVPEPTQLTDVIVPAPLPDKVPEPTQLTDVIVPAPLPDKVPEPTQLTDVIVPAPLPDKVPEPTQLTDVIVPAPLPDIEQAQQQVVVPIKEISDIHAKLDKILAHIDCQPAAISSRRQSLDLLASILQENNIVFPEPASPLKQPAITTFYARKTSEEEPPETILTPDISSDDSDTVANSISAPLPTIPVLPVSASRTISPCATGSILEISSFIDAMHAPATQFPELRVRHQKIWDVKKEASSLSNFAWQLTKELYTTEDLTGKNYHGTRGKNALSPRRRHAIEHAVSDVFGSTQLKSAIEAINTGLRNLGRKKKKILPEF